jgi:diguanylate cyclase (GGDEF)-like protein
MIHALIADDDEALRSLVSQVLEADGYSVDVAADGESAWKLFQKRVPDLVFADIRMPCKSGLDLLADIQRTHPQTHVIIMTSHASLETAIGALKSGAYDYLIKPFEDLELISCAARRAVESLELERERDALMIELRDHNRELEKLNRMFRELAVKDGLTGLYNHRYAQEALLQEADRGKLHQRPMSVLYADLDYFKLFNDTHGHQQGDLLLKMLAKCLTAEVRTTDIVARWGGEEFIVIAPETDTSAAMVLAKEIRAAVAALEVPGRETQPNGIVSISIGVATLGEHAGGASGLLAQADQALYRAKGSGRDAVCVAEGFVNDTDISGLTATTARQKILGR